MTAAAFFLFEISILRRFFPYHSALSFSIWAALRSRAVFNDRAAIFGHRRGGNLYL